MHLEAVVLAERSGVEEQLDSLARGELPRFVLALNPLRAPTLQSPLVELLELLDLLFDRQG